MRDLLLQPNKILKTKLIFSYQILNLNKIKNANLFVWILPRLREQWSNLCHQQTVKYDDTNQKTHNIWNWCADKEKIKKADVAISQDAMNIWMQPLFRLVIVMDRSFYIRRIDSDAVLAQYDAMNLVTNWEVLDPLVKTQSTRKRI